MEKILISACLCGDKTRYDGKSNYNPLISKLLEKYELIPFCGEVEGGLSVPRLPSEIQKDRQVLRSDGKNVTKNYLKGVDLALNICSFFGIRICILKEGSPCCGVHKIYDGTFSSRKIEGNGLLTSALKRKGIRVISEEEIELFLEEND